MSEVVIDTNVWVFADRITSIDAEVSASEADCIEACYRWLQDFTRSDDRLVVDRAYRIIREYRNNIRKDGISEQLLNQLEVLPLERLTYIDIKYDRNGHAILPPPLTFEDEEDRKFIGVAAAVEPFAPIYNAADPDWEKEREQLAANGLVIHELCPDYISERIRDG